MAKKLNYSKFGVFLDQIYFLEKYTSVNLII